MSMSLDCKKKLLSVLLGKSSSSPIGTKCYVGLLYEEPSSGENGEITCSEPSSEYGYARSLIGNASDTSSQIMTVSNAGVASNSSTIYFPEASESWGDPLTYFGLFSSATGGSPHIWGALNESISVTVEHVPLFRAGTLTLEFE